MSAAKESPDKAEIATNPYTTEIVTGTGTVIAAEMEIETEVHDCDWPLQQQPS